MENVQNKNENTNINTATDNKEIKKSTYSKDNYIKYKEKIIVNQRKYREKNKDKIKQSKTNYYEKNKLKVNRNNLLSRMNNKGYVPTERILQKYEIVKDETTGKYK